MHANPLHGLADTAGFPPPYCSECGHASPCRCLRQFALVLLVCTALAAIITAAKVSIVG